MDREIKLKKLKMKLIKNFQMECCKKCNSLDDCQNQLSDNKIILSVKKDDNCIMLNSLKAVDKFIEA